MRAAKSEGKYSEGVSDLPARSICEAAAPTVLFKNPFTSRTTMQHTLSMDRGMAFDEALARLEREKVRKK